MIMKTKQTTRKQNLAAGGKPKLPRPFAIGGGKPPLPIELEEAADVQTTSGGKPPLPVDEQNLQARSAGKPPLP
jgi:hypothetical protein